MILESIVSAVRKRLDSGIRCRHTEPLAAGPTRVKPFLLEQLMADRYFWLKLQTKFFATDDIRVIQAQPNGDKYVVFWLKLLLKAIEQSEPGLLRYKKDIPYSPETLAIVTDTDIDVVKSAIQLFQLHKMITLCDNGDIWIESIHEMIGSESTSAKRVRAFRARRARALLGNGDVTKGNTELDLEKSKKKKEKIAKDEDEERSRSSPLEAAPVAQIPKEIAEPLAQLESTLARAKRWKH